MENRELIIPARFDSKDAAAGLRAIEESGHAADDLGRAADAASARFRKAHESVQASAQDYLRLRQSLRHAAANEATPTAGATDVRAGAESPPSEWLESAAGLLAAGARRGGREDGPSGEPLEGSQQGPSPLAKMGGPAPRQGGAWTGADPLTSASAGPVQGDWGEIPLRAMGGARDSGPGGAPDPGDGLAFHEVARNAPNPLQNPTARSDEPSASLDGRGILARIRGRQGSVEDVDDPGAGAGRAGRMAREAVSDYREWMTGGRDGSRGGVAIERSVGPIIPDGEAGMRSPGMEPIRGGGEARQGVAMSPEGWDLLEGIRRARAASPAAPSLAGSPVVGPAMGHAWDRNETAPGGHGSESRFGGASTDVIERLLREQNDLIRQDLQRNAHPPIAAPPPLRGGGIRM